jgi:peptidoglycan/xylan/chitin deacetylase (PgdA/CDA1 family)
VNLPLSRRRALLLCGAALTPSCNTAGGKKGKNNAAAASAMGEESSPPEALPTSTGTRDSYNRVATSLPFLSLTFDDGPHPTHTPRLLDILKQRNVKATFYVIGTNVKRYPEIMRRIVGEGHEVANHSTTHPSLAKLSDEGVRRELQVCHDAIVSTTGVAPRTMRPPYGAITSAQKSWIRKEFGYPTILWSVDPLDWKKPGASVVASRLVSGASAGGILLAHDIHQGTIDAMPSTIDQLLGRGFRFATVTELIAMEGRG